MAKTATTKTTTAEATNVAPATAPAKETKMALAKPLFEKVMGMTEAERGGKTPRRLFMDLAAEQLDMKAAGANTYFQNLKNEKETGVRYPYTPSSKAPTASADPSAPVDLAAQVQVLGTKITQMNRTLNKLAKAQAAHA